jgi:hypothetical protein
LYWLLPYNLSPQEEEMKDGEIAFGRQFNKNFAAGMGLGYFNTEGEQRFSGRANGMGRFEV